jgi:hypothetical protein
MTELFNYPVSEPTGRVRRVRPVDEIKQGIECQKDDCEQGSERSHAAKQSSHQSPCLDIPVLCLDTITGALPKNLSVWSALYLTASDCLCVSFLILSLDTWSMIT